MASSTTTVKTVNASTRRVCATMNVQAGMGVPRRRLSWPLSRCAVTVIASWANACSTIHVGDEAAGEVGVGVERPAGEALGVVRARGEDRVEEDEQDDGERHPEDEHARLAVSIA